MTHPTLTPANDSDAANCIACEGRPVFPNNPCAICGKRAITRSVADEGLREAIKSRIWMNQRASTAAEEILALIAAREAALRSDDEAGRVGQRAGGTEGEPTYIVPLHPTEHMLRCAKNALRNHINSVPPDERAARWGEPAPGRGYLVDSDEKHRVRFQAMLLAAPTPSTSCEDRLRDRERALSTLRAQLAEQTRRAEEAERTVATMNAVSLHQTDRPIEYQFDGALRVRFHPLTCGNDSNHMPLWPWCDDGRVKLICRDCDYTQNNAAMFGRPSPHSDNVAEDGHGQST